MLHSHQIMASFEAVKTNNDAQWFSGIARACVHGDSALKVERYKKDSCWYLFWDCMSQLRSSTIPIWEGYDMNPRRVADNLTTHLGWKSPQFVKNEVIRQKSMGSLAASEQGDSWQP
jgi:hypothetical protein